MLKILGLFLVSAIVFSQNLSYSTDYYPKMLFQWPCNSSCEIVDYFDENLGKFSAGNRGIDLAMKSGEKVFTPYDGEIFFVGKIARKHVLSIKHANNIRSTFVGVKSDLPAGSRVKTGDIIGDVDYADMKTPALHFGVIYGEDKYLNPLSFLRKEIVLLPVL